MNKLFLSLLFFIILVFPSYAFADGPYLNIPPTNAFDRIVTSNGTVHAANFSMPLIIKGLGNTTITGSNGTHTIFISGSGGGGSTNCTATTYTDQTNNRTMNTIYHNTSGKTIMALIIITENTKLATDNAEAIFSIGTVSPPPSIVADTFLTNETNGARVETLTVIIPNDYYYELDNTLSSGFGVAAIGTWSEFQNPSCGTTTIINNNISNFGKQGTYNETLANGVLINKGGYKLNFINGTGNPINVKNSTNGQVNITISSNGGVKSLTVIGSDSGNATTGNILLTTKTYQNNTGANLGIHGIGPFASMLGSVLQFFSFVSANNQLGISSNSTNIILTVQHVITDAFKSNSITCAAGNFFNSFSNTTGTFGCSSAITSLNSDTSAAQTIQGSGNNITVTNAGATHTVNIGSNPLIVNGANQTVTKGVNFNKAAKITGLLLNSTSKTGSYTATSTDDSIYVNATNGNYTVTLPAISVVGKGKVFTIKKIDFSKNYVEIIPTSSTVDYFNNMNLTNPMDTVELQNNGTTWFTKDKLIFTDTSNILKNTANSWFGAWVNQGTPTTFATANDTLYAVPFKLSRSTSISNIESEVTTGGGASNCRMALYTDSGQGYPQNKIFGSDTSAFTTQTRTTRTLINNFTSNIHLPEGQYYLAVDCDDGSNGPATITLDTISAVTSATSSTAATQTISITVGNNNNRALVVGISYIKLSNPNNANNDVISTVKIGATSFTKAVNSTRGNSTVNIGMDSELWYLQNPTVGANTITITPVTTASYDIATAAYSIFNVAQGTAIGATANNGSTTRTSSISITPTHTNAWLIENILGFSVTGAGEAVPTNPSDTSGWTQILSTQAAGASERNMAPVINSVNKLKWQWNSPANARQLTADTALELIPSNQGGTMPSFRAIPQSSLGPFLGMPSTMGATNGNTMYTVTYDLSGTSVNTLPDPFPSGAAVATSAVPEILVKVVG